MPKIALAQMSASSSLEDNLARSVRFIELAATHGADLVVFPEIHLSPFFPKHAGQDAGAWLLSLDGAEIRRLREACRSCGIHASPNVYLAAEGGTFDASLMIDAGGEIIGISKMMHIVQAPGFFEQDYYTPSREGIRVFDTPFGKVGIVICFDRHYPESFRHCSLNGADMVIVPTANTHGEPLDVFEWEIRIAAFHNGIHIAMCNRVGVEDGVSYCGRSIIADPRGALLLEMRDTEDLGCAEFDLEDARKSRKNNTFLELYNTEAFGNF